MIVMKKIARVLLCLVLLVSMLSLAACGGEASGRYTIASMEAQGMTIDGALLDASLAAIGCTKEDVYIEFRADGTGTLAAMDEVSEFKYEGTTMWPVEEPDNKVEFEVDGDSVIIEKDGASMTFTK